MTQIPDQVRAHLRGHFARAGFDGEPDSASVTYDREMDYTLEENSEDILREIDDALKRITEGTYGVCENRGEQISPERLEAIPWTRLCIDCKRLEER